MLPGAMESVKQSFREARPNVRWKLRQAVAANLQSLLDCCEPDETAATGTSVTRHAESAEGQCRRGEGRGDVGVNVPDWQLIHEASKRFRRPREDRRREAEGGSVVPCQ